MSNPPGHRARLRAWIVACLPLVISFCGTQAARSETDKLRIAQQFGVGYLPLIVSNEKGFVEDEARKLGIKPPTIEWLRLSGAAAAVADPLDRQLRLAGFGHSIYRSGDPRVAPLMEAVGALDGADRRLATVAAVRAEAMRALGRHTNVDFALGALLYVAGLPTSAPLFAVARIAGWAAHAAEEATERPLRYRGLARTPT